MESDRYSSFSELEDERAWKTRFESTTNEQWDRLAHMVRQEAGGIKPARPPQM
jgi:hypothetical protein